MKNKKIAIIDTGVKDIQIQEIYSVFDDDGIDENGHGSQIIEHIKNINPNAYIISIKALKKNGTGDVQDILTAINLALELQVDIINMSFAASRIEKNLPIINKVRDAIKRGVIVVASAGDYCNNTENYIPACIDKAIVVAACDENNELLENSNIGNSIDYIVPEKSSSLAAATISAFLTQYEKSLLKDNFVTIKPEQIKKTFDTNAFVKDFTVAGYSSTHWINNGSSGGYYRAYITLWYDVTAQAVKGTGGGQTLWVDGYSGSYIKFHGSSGTNSWTYSGNCWAVNFTNSSWDNTNWYYTGFTPKAMTLSDSTQTVSYWVDFNYGSAGWVTASASVTVPARKKVAVTFNGNGATTNTFGTQTFYEQKSGQSFEGTCTRTGYDFVRWGLNGTATSGWNYHSGLSDAWIRDHSPSVTLYAVWTKKTWIVHYNANGGSGAPSNQTKTYGETLTLRGRGSLTHTTVTATVTWTMHFNANGGSVSPTTKLATAVRVRSSFSASGWSTSSNGGGTNYAFSGSYTTNNTATMYAVWNYTQSYRTASSITLPTPSKSTTTGIATRTIHFNANGGSVSPTSKSSTSIATVSYTQTGWYTSSTNGTKIGNAGATFYMTANNRTAYAHYNASTAYGTWTAVSLPTPSKSATTATATKTVYFNPNGGTTTKASQAATALVTTSYTQTGWYSSSTNGTRYAAAGANYTPSSTMTMYAHYNPSYSTGTFSSVTLPTAAQCTRNGFKLLGFSTASGAASANYDPGASYPGSYNTAYAVWRKISWIWNGSTWRTAVPWLWNGSTWRITAPYVWDGSGWK